MARRVVTSPFAFATGAVGGNLSAVEQESQVGAVPVDSTTSRGRYAPPPMVGETSVVSSLHSSPQQQGRATSLVPGEAQGVSAFTELSNKAPPPLYQFSPATSPFSGPLSDPLRSGGASREPGEPPCPTQLIPNQRPGEILQFLTKSSPIPPPAASDFVCLDHGNCGPRYMRSSMYCIPNSRELASKVGVPLGLVLQPLADALPGDSLLPLITPRPSIVRCSRCQAYHSSLDQFVEGGKAFVCYLCQHVNPVSSDYFSPLGHDGLRMDVNQRAELCCGSVEYVAPAEYVERPSMPGSFVFLLETSSQAFKSGIIHAFAESVRAIISTLPRNSPVRFGFVTFHREIRFYGLHKSYSKPRIYVTPDIQDINLPTEPLGNLLVSVRNSAAQIEQFLEMLPQLCEIEEDPEIPVCTAIAVRTTGLLLKNVGGKVIILQSSLPSAPPASLLNRFKPEMLGTSRERELYQNQNSYFQDMARDCSKYRISYDHFIFPFNSSYIDVATVKPLCQTTGGQMYFYSRFDYATDRLKLHQQLHRILTRTSGTDAIIRIRTGTGLELVNSVGSFRLENGTDMCLSSLSCDTMICANFKVADSLPDESFAGIQCVVAYTTSFGERRIRVHSLRLPTSSNYRKVIAAIDLDALVYLNCSRYMEACLSQDLSSVREQVIEDCVSPLTGFKFNSGENVGQGLALPEALRLYPMYQSCLLKSPLLKDNPLSVDYRLAERFQVRNMPLRDFSLYLYPRMFALHNLSEMAGTRNESGDVILPPWQKLRQQTLVSGGCFLLDGTTLLLMWIGNAVAPEFMQEVFDVPSLRSSASSGMQLSTDDSRPTVHKINQILEQIRRQRSYTPPLYLVMQGSANDLQFTHMMREDRVENTLSHNDLLALLRNRVSQFKG